MKRFFSSSSFLRNFIFGVEDSLVSTVGLLSGIASASVPAKTIILTGSVLIFVEAFSMAVGSFLSEHSVEDYRAHRETHAPAARFGGMVMFFSYFLSGFIPLIPYAMFPIESAFWISIFAALFALFLLGIFGGEFSGVKPFHSGVRMLVLGGITVLVGVLVGKSLE